MFQTPRNAKYDRGLSGRSRFVDRFRKRSRDLPFVLRVTIDARRRPKTVNARYRRQIDRNRPGRFCMRNVRRRPTVVRRTVDGTLAVRRNRLQPFTGSRRATPKSSTAQIDPNTGHPVARAIVERARENEPAAAAVVFFVSLII